MVKAHKWHKDKELYMLIDTLKWQKKCYEWAKGEKDPTECCRCRKESLFAYWRGVKNIWTTSKGIVED